VRVSKTCIPKPLIHPDKHLLPGGEGLHGLKNNWILQLREKPYVQNDSNREWGILRTQPNPSFMGEPGS